ncbi:MAG TPA: hypothetical protein DEA90_01415 [Opitutae bacterium]|nr:hypothetical protein [Puniceicoccaceae bacterium]HBR92806.1 hypothetical protein [Opitutae bacterium]
MVALNTVYAPSKTHTWAKNRVGDFFCQDADYVGENRPEPATASGKNDHATTMLCQVLIITG